MLRGLARAVLVVVVLALVPLAVPAHASAATAKRKPTVAKTAKVQAKAAVNNQFAKYDLAGSGAWCWFADPRAIHHEGQFNRTYIGWIDRGGSIMVASYDHTTRRRTSAILMRKFQVDDHNTPALLIRPDGHLLVFWSSHAGSQMYYRRSVRPEDVSAWEPTRTVGVNSEGGAGYTYPNPVQLKAEGNKLWLFWRGGNFNPTFSTTMDGKAWSPARTMIRVPGARPYMKVDSDGVDTIHFAFTEAHPRNLTTSIYYMAYRGGSFYKADGTRIGGVEDLPFTPAQVDKVYDADANGGVKAWVHDVAFDAAGKPVITFATFPSADDHRYHYARWLGDRWMDVELVKAGGTISGDPYEEDYSGGITLDHEDPSVLYMSRPVNGQYEIERWKTADGGVTWGVEAITANSTEPNVRPISPRGLRSGDMDVIWMSGRYPAYANFRTRLSRTGAPVANPAPAASWGAPSYTGTSPFTARFDGRGSSDPNGTVRAWQWTFGDGTTGSGAATAHVYRTAGTYWARLLVTDNGGARDELVGEITVGRPITTRLRISATPTSTTYGHTVTIGGRLVRADNGRWIPGQVIEVHGRPAGTTTWTLLARIRAGSDGLVRYQRKPAGDAEFTLRHTGSSSTSASASGIVVVHVKR